MKEAKVAEIWTDIYKKDFPVCLELIRFRDVPSIQSLRIDLAGALTVICGANGVGKTTILHLLHQVLGVVPAVPPNHDNDIALPAHLRSGRITAIGTNQALRFVSRRDVLNQTIMNAGTVPPVTRLDLADCFAQLKLLRDEQNIGQLLEGLESRLATAEEIAEANYVLGRNYSAIQTYEIEDLADAPEAVPYFIVTEGSCTYGSFGMGLGELGVHYALWQLHRIAGPRILLVEEPETHIAPFSQVHLLTLVAKYALTRSLWVVLVTHSPTMLTAVPLKHVRLISRLQGVVSVRTPNSSDDLSNELGIPSSVRAVVLVEDARGIDLVLSTLRYNNCPAVRQLEIVSAGGESHIDTALKTMPRTQRIKLIGVFDGDQRSKPKSGLNHPYGFLPGSAPPEQVLRKLVYENMELVAAALPQNNLALLHGRLAAIQGEEPHLWFRKLSAAYALRTIELCNILVGIAMSNATFAAEAKELSDLVSRALGVPSA